MVIWQCGQIRCLHLVRNRGGGHHEDFDRGWLDQWLKATCVMDIPSSLGETKCHHLFLSGARTIIMISKTVSVLLINLILERHNAVLSLVWSHLWTQNGQRNALAYPAKDHLPTDILWAAERSSWVLKDEFIRMAVIIKPRLSRPWHQGTIKPQPSTSCCLEMSSNIRTSSRKRTKSFQVSAHIPSRMGKGKKFWRFLASISVTSGMCLKCGIGTSGKISGQLSGWWKFFSLDVAYPSTTSHPWLGNPSSSIPTA